MSYASEQKADAEAVAFSLRSRGHMVFFDRDDLPEGTSYDDRIAAAVDRSDLMIFLISPAAVAEGRYTLTELRFARYKWRHPGGRVLPVMMEATPLPAVPSYLRAVSILEP
ncbi:MAG TPA: toll/interleukin-1 receptor domain-containing protein, partial [Vicinamibacterales bacterium]